MENIPDQQPEVEKGVYRSPVGDFETLKPNELKVEDIKSGDRVIVSTASGNRYMFRRSVSAGGRVKVYNEKEGDFKTGDGHLCMIRDESNGIVAKIGESLSLGVEVGDKIEPWKSTPVTEIEVRIGIDNVIKDLPKESLASMLIKEVNNKGDI